MRCCTSGSRGRCGSRLLSYFRASPNEKASQIIANTHEIAWEYVPSEFAAVVAELRAIQRWQPPYNVEHRRDRAFCFVKLTREAAPRLLTVREVRADGAQYFGPFRGAERVRETVREVCDVLELRDCAAGTPMRFADQLDMFGAEHTPLCLRAQVHKCLAPCAGHCSRSAYAAQVELARRFLDGDAEPPLRILRARLQTAADGLNFEYAAALRDRIARLGRSHLGAALAARRHRRLTFVYEGQARRETGSTSYGEAASGRSERHRARPTSAAGSRPMHAASSPARSTRKAPCSPRRPAEILLLARWFRLHPEERALCCSAGRTGRGARGKQVRNNGKRIPPRPRRGR